MEKYQNDFLGKEAFSEFYPGLITLKYFPYICYQSMCANFEKNFDKAQDMLEMMLYALAF